MNKRERILLEARLWKIQKENLDKDYFKNLTNRGKPSILWVESFGNPAQAVDIANTEPDEILVYRNHGGQCRTDDASFLASLESFLESDSSRFIIVCGHSLCDTIQNVAAGKSPGVYGSRWTEDIQELYEQYSMEMTALSARQRERKLCELNVRRQLDNLCAMDIVQRAWSNGSDLQLLGWYLDIHKGDIQELHTVCARDVQKEVTTRL